MQRLIRVSKACTGNKRPEAIATLAAGVDGASRVRDQALPAWAEVAAAIQPLQLAMGPAELQRLQKAADAQRKAYAEVGNIHWDGEFHRGDIGWRAIERN